MRVVIRGGGDIATGIALRLIRSGMEVVLCELANPTAIRRTVSFSECMRTGETAVEGITARRAHLSQVERLLAQNIVPVLEDPSAGSLPGLHADALVDAILAKVNLGTRLDMAPVVVGVGPGFTAGEDCHAVVETMRGHTLGRVYYEGSALPNTNIPGLIGGFAGERVLRAPADGVFHQLLEIGAQVEERVLKEMNYLMREREEQEEERFRKLDEAIRSRQRRGRKEKAAKRREKSGRIRLRTRESVS